MSHSPSPDDAISALYVDTDTDRAAAVRRSIRAVHPTVRLDTVHSTAAALDSLSETSPDCVVARTDLPGPVEFLSTVEARAPTATTILYGPEQSPELLRRARTADIDAHVSASETDARAVLGDHVVASAVGADDGSNEPASPAAATPESDRPRASDSRRADASAARSDSDASADPADSAPYLDTLLDITSDLVVAIDDESVVQFVNPAVEDVLGYAPAELEGEPLTTVMPERLREGHRQGLRRYLRTGERSLDWDDIELPAVHRDGHEVHLSIAFNELGPPDDRRFIGIARDVTERRRREDQLASLNETAQALSRAETTQEVCELAVDAAAETLGLSISSIQLYEVAAGGLRTVAQTEAAAELVADGPLFGGRDVPWDVYASSSGRVIDDVRGQGDDGESNAPLRSGIVLPIGAHGVFVTGETEPNAFSESAVVLANILVANVRAALERTDREERLRERTAELEARTETLERVNRINTVIRDVTRALTEATTREEIEQVVCAKVASADPYRFAWVGTPETMDGSIVPTASAGAERGYLDDITVTTGDEPTGRGPAGRAVRTREPQVQNDFQRDPPFEPWRASALKRGFKSGISVPLVYKETLYGVLNLYASETDVFDELEVSVLAELGKTIGFAINALERRKALVDDRAVELEFRVHDPSIPPVTLAVETEGSFALDALVQQTDGTIRIFFVVDTDPDAVVAHVEQTLSADDVNFVAERDDGSLFEATLTDESFFGRLLDYGAYPTGFTADEDGGTLTLELPRTGDIRAFLDMFVETYDGVELVARRELDRPIQTESQFRALYRERLTERQEEVLRTAYLAGFFDWPRKVTGKEVAALLGVSQPTVNRHVRKGEYELFSLLFGGEGDDDGD